MPAESYIYALPYEYYKKYGIRRYGFHGTSHKYVAERASYMMNVNLDDLKIITCHLGNGASVSAIKRGVCIDTSMGFTPLDGLVMGTRSGYKFLHLQYFLLLSILKSKRKQHFYKMINLHCTKELQYRQNYRHTEFPYNILL